MEVGRAVTVRRRVPTSLDRDEEFRRPSALERAAAGRDGKHGVGVAVEEEHGRGGKSVGVGAPRERDRDHRLEDHGVDPVVVAARVEPCAERGDRSR